MTKGARYVEPINLKPVEEAVAAMPAKGPARLEEHSAPGVLRALNQLMLNLRIASALVCLMSRDQSMR